MRTRPASQPRPGAAIRELGAPALCCPTLSVAICRLGLDERDERVLNPIGARRVEGVIDRPGDALDVCRASPSQHGVRLAPNPTYYEFALANLGVRRREKVEYLRVLA